MYWNRTQDDIVEDGHDFEPLLAVITWPARKATKRMELLQATIKMYVIDTGSDSHYNRSQKMNESK